MIEYKQVYSERIVQPKEEAQGDGRYQQFLHLTLYEATGQDSFRWPMMVKVCTGFQGDEDWDTTWEMIPWHTGKPKAIREVIKRLDNHVIEPLPENS